MRIVNGHIDGFGILAPQDLPDLSPGLSVFMGRNEAGKSTCLDFFRAMLAGYPDPRSREARQRPATPLNGGTGGGSLLLRTDLAGLVRLTRRPGSGGGQSSLADAEGAPLDTSLADRLFAGVTRELYRNVYGFSLGELQTFESLDAEGVRNALYGASFGLGVRPPGEALARLDKKLEELFKSGGKKPVVNRLLADLKQVRDSLRNHESDARAYEDAATRRDAVEAALAGLRERRAAAETDIARLERRQNGWHLWEEAVRLEGQLARLVPVVEDFPVDGVARLEQLLEKTEERAAALAALRTRLIRLEDERATLHPDSALIAEAAALELLTERKTSCRNALTALPGLHADLAHVRETLATRLAALGPEWSVARARALDRSLFARERIAAHEKDLQEAAAAEDRARAEHVRCQREHGEASHEAEMAQAVLRGIAAPAVPPLPASVAERLAAHMDRAATALEELPEARRAEARARKEVMKAARGLHPLPGLLSEDPLRSATAHEPAGSATGMSPDMDREGPPESLDGLPDAPMGASAMPAPPASAPEVHQTVAPHEAAAHLADRLLEDREGLLALARGVVIAQQAREETQRELNRQAARLAEAESARDALARRLTVLHERTAADLGTLSPAVAPDTGRAAAWTDGMPHGDDDGTTAPGIADISAIAAAVEARGVALRRLGRSVAESRLARATLAGLEERRSAHWATVPAPLGNPLLFALGMACLLAGLCLQLPLVPFVAAQPFMADLLTLFGVPEPTPAPLLLAGAVLTLLGVVLGMTGRARPAPAMGPHMAEAHRLETALTTARHACDRYGAEIADLAAQAGAEATDDAALERATLRLERLRDAAATLKRLADEAEVHAATCLALEEQVADDSRRDENAATRLASAREALATRLAQHGTTLVDAEAVPPLIERAGAVRVLAERAALATRTVRTLEGHLNTLAQRAAHIPPLLEAWQARHDEMRGRDARPARAVADTATSSHVPDTVDRDGGPTHGPASDPGSGLSKKAQAAVQGHAAASPAQPTPGGTAAARGALSSPSLPQDTVRDTTQDEPHSAMPDSPPAVPSVPTVPPLETPADGALLVEVVRQHLAALREADRTRQDRQRAEDALATAEARLDRCATALRKAREGIHAAQAQAEGTLRAWLDLLETQGLAPGLTPGTARDAFAIAEECMALDDSARRIMADIRQQEAERDALALPLAEICSRLGRHAVHVTGTARMRMVRETTGDTPAGAPIAEDMQDAAGTLAGTRQPHPGTPAGSATSDVDWLATLDALVTAAHEARALHGRLMRLEEERATLGDDIRTAEGGLTAAREALADLLADAGAADTEDFRRREAAWKERTALSRRLGELEDALAIAAGNDPVETLRRDLAATDLGTLEAQVTTLREELDAMRKEESTLVDEAGTLRATLNTLASADTLAALRRQESTLLEELRVKGLEWARHALARHFLVSAKRRFEEERQPQVIREASGLFADITDGAWTGIAASLEDNSLRVTPPHGEPVAPDALSRGTQEQLYLALRLAYIRSHAAHAEPLPVIMDDILVNFDPARAARTARALAALAKGDAATPGHQILFFTCHPHTLSLLQDAVPGASCFEMERGRIALA